MQPTPEQNTTLVALRTFAHSGSYIDPHPANPSIVVAAQGYHRAVAITTDGRPFMDNVEAVLHQGSLDGRRSVLTHR